MTWCIIVHEKELQTHRASKKTHIGKKNLVTITGSVDSTCVEDVKVCMTTKHDASPNENTATSIPVPFNDVRGMIAASPLSPDEYAMRIATQTESALICKEYSSPLIVSPIPVFPAPQRTPSPMGRR
ncbi:hypothetical protein TNCV_190881 [Trichonephila clavipes]|nr:hypothetical protein TNCV_190881 [Trichonephila clavipes]